MREWVSTLVFYAVLIALGLILRTRAIRRFRASLEKAYPRPRAGLIRNDGATWRNARKLREIVAALETLGFEDAGTFEIEGRPGHRMKGMVKPSESISAQIYEQPILGIYTSLYTRYQDGTRLTYSNIPNNGIMAERPGADVVRLPRLDPTHLYLRFVNERRQAPMRPMTAAEFVTDYEAWYSGLMEWMALRGGYSYDEIRAARGRLGRRMAPKFARIAAETFARKAAEALIGILRDRFGAENGLAAEQRDRLIVVHDRLMAEDVAALFAHEAGVDLGEVKSNISTATPREWFAALNEGLPHARRLVRLGSVAEPVPADVYGRPGDDHVIPIEAVMLSEG